MKICIERSDRMGDMILTLPIIQGIKEKNPDAIIDVVASKKNLKICKLCNCLLYTSPSPRDQRGSRMPSSA